MRKRLLHVEQLAFFGDMVLKFLGALHATWYRKGINVDQGVAILSGMGKKTHVQYVFGPGGEAITAGVAAVGQTQILAATALTEDAQTILAAGLVAQPDCARCIRLVAISPGATAVGDGGFDTAAHSRVVKITGTDINGRTIEEWIPVNDTTAIVGKKAFATITQVILPGWVNDATDEISLGYGIPLGLELPVEAAADIIEYGVKTGAGTAYVITAMPTMDIATQASTLAEAIDATETEVDVASGTPFTDGADAFATGYWVEICHKNGNVEEAFAWDKSATDRLTLVRGCNGTTARPAPLGTPIVRRSGMTFAPAAITAEDRFKMVYRTAAM